MRRPLFIVMTAMILGEVSVYLGGIFSLIIDGVVVCFLFMGFFVHYIYSSGPVSGTGHLFYGSHRGSHGFFSGMVKSISVMFNIRRERTAVKGFLIIALTAFIAGQILYAYVCHSKGIEKSLYGDWIQKPLFLENDDQRERGEIEEIFVGRDPSREKGVKEEITAAISGVVETVKEKAGGTDDKKDEDGERDGKKTLILKKGAKIRIHDQTIGGSDHADHLYGKCILTGWTGEVLPEDRIEASGSLLALEEVRNPGQFPLKSYRLSQGIRVCFHAGKGKIRSRPLISFRRWAYTIRKLVEGGYEEGFSYEEQALLKAMALGDKSDLSEEERSLYEENGAAHLLSLSGLHVSIIAGRFFRMMRRRKKSYGLSCTVSAFFIFFYGLIVTGGSSLIRASIMFASFLLAEYLGAEYDMISAMSLAMILMLMESPFRAFEGGCIISFASVFAIGMVLPAALQWRNKRNEWGRTQRREKGKRLREPVSSVRVKKNQYGGSQENDILSPIKGSLFSGLVISSVTAPLIMMIYYEWSPYSILLNLVIIPAMVPLMLSAVIGAFLFLTEHVIGLVLPISLILKGCASISCLPAVWIIRAFHGIFTMVRKVPAALVVTGHLKIGQVILIYGLEVLIFIGYCRRKYVLIVSTAFMLAFVAAIPRRPVLGITMLDIGQGDSILVRCPDGYNILIDSGSSSDQEIASYVIKPALKYYGIASLDGIVISHFDQDHISGVRDLLKSGYPVGCLLVASPGPEEEKDKNRLTILNLARKQGIPVRYLKRGDRFSLDTVSFFCLNPLSESTVRKVKGQEAGPGLAEGEGEERNARSVVLYMKWKQFDAVFTGDIGQEEEKMIKAYLQEYADMPASNRKDETAFPHDIMNGICFLKAAHHGSSHSSCKDFLDLARPAITGISAGRKNNYGHPGEQTLARLKESGASKVYCTSWAGAVCLETDGKTIRAGYAGP